MLDDNWFVTVIGLTVIVRGAVAFVTRAVEQFATLLEDALPLSVVARTGAKYTKIDAKSARSTKPLVMAITYRRGLASSM